MHVIIIIAYSSKKYYSAFYSYRSDIAEIEPALELLNTHGADFDMVEVNMLTNVMLNASNWLFISMQVHIAILRLRYLHGFQGFVILNPPLQ